MPPKKLTAAELKAQVASLQATIEKNQEEIAFLKSIIEDYNKIRESIKEKEHFIAHSKQYAHVFKTKLLAIADDFTVAIQKEEAKYKRFPTMFAMPFKEIPHKLACPLLHPILKTAYENFITGSQALYQKVTHPNNTLIDEKRVAFENSLQSIHHSLTTFIASKPQGVELDTFDSLLYTRADDLLGHVNAALIGLKHLENLPQKIESAAHLRDYEEKEVLRLERENVEMTNTRVQQIHTLQSELNDILKELTEAEFMGNDDSEQPIAMPEETNTTKKSLPTSQSHQREREPSQR